MARQTPAPKQKRPTKKEVRKQTRAERRVRVGNVSEITPGAAPELHVRDKGRKRSELQFRSQAQYNYAQLMEEKILVIGDGVAGTGKSYVATRWAAQKLEAGEIKRIIITRPMVEAADESMGFLPGDENEKFAPYFEPIRQILLEDFTQTHLENMMKRGAIEIKPLPLIRGLTFDNAVVILDEAQNTTPKQMKLLLSRIGENCTVIINGDDDQKDIKTRSGLEDILTRFNDMDSVGRLTFMVEDIVRSGFVRDVMERYRRG